MKLIQKTLVYLTVLLAVGTCVNGFAQKPDKKTCIYELDNEGNVIKLINNSGVDVSFNLVPYGGDYKVKKHDFKSFGKKGKSCDRIIVHYDRYQDENGDFVPGKNFDIAVVKPVTAVPSSQNENTVSSNTPSNNLPPVPEIPSRKPDIKQESSISPSAEKEFLDYSDMPNPEPEQVKAVETAKGTSSFSKKENNSPSSGQPSSFSHSSDVDKSRRDVAATYVEKEQKREIVEKPAPVIKDNPINILIPEPAPVLDTPERHNRIDKNQVLSDFEEYIEKVPYFSKDTLAYEDVDVDEYLSNLEVWPDKEAYVTEYLETLSLLKSDSLKAYRSFVDTYVDDFFMRYESNEIEDRSECEDGVRALLDERLEHRERNLEKIDDAIRSVRGGLSPKTIMTIVIAALLLISAVGLFIGVMRHRKKMKGTGTSASGTRLHQPSVSPAVAGSNIVVRRKTSSILRRQSLDDVVDNVNYLCISSNDFCGESAIRNIYIKNSCIKQIYNMYAEDLRNPENPKEDGCFVVGRWVQDPSTQTYDVSLEEVVMPGDDAVFKEYELNFGGKIKLKLREKLKQLRINTNLQYDLTCWVHSHPGLGVFFSNSDNTVHTQLKHSSHPKFLTAMVIDILTPDQETGIFTFKHDGTVTSKNDLTSLFSLEEMYKWAVESERNAFNPDNYYDLLAHASARKQDYAGLMLSNGAVIDMNRYVAEPEGNLAAYVHGFTQDSRGGTNYIVNAVSSDEKVADMDMLGGFVTVTYRSIPTIQKAVREILGKVKFVLVYSTSDDLLTCIPVVNQELCSDEKYYGEQTLEELKIWTRRKR